MAEIHILDREQSRRLVHHSSMAHPIPDDDPFPATEAGDSEFFARLVSGRFGYDHTRRAWFVFGPHHWRQDTTATAVQEAIDAMRRRQALALKIIDTAERAKAIKWAVGGESDSRIKHLLDLASSHPDLALVGTEWDLDAWTLGVTNGIVDLRTGTLRSGAPEDRVTRVAAVPYDPTARAPRWRRFVLEVCDNDEALAAFLHRSFGYGLTGDTSEQAFWILYGLGANGKSTLLEMITKHVIPEHSWTMAFPVHAWTESLSEYQRAELVGRRLVVAKESEQAKRINTEFVKSLTGSETVNARHPYGRPFTFTPNCKVFLAANHRPIIRDDTHGMWRRVRLVPFLRTFPVDATLPEILATEAPGILTWMVEGCGLWQRHGLCAPDSVTAATEDYRRDSDVLLRFFAARCVLGEHRRVQSGPLLAAFRSWCEHERIPEEERLGRGTFLDRLRREFQTIEGQRLTYKGLGLVEENTTP